MKSIKIFKHVTDGGATYLTDNHKFKDADIIIRIDGGAELIRCNTDTKAFDEEPIDILMEGESKPSAEIKLSVLFGLDACKSFDNGEITEEVKNNLITRTFETEGEKKAYIRGLVDNIGWGDYSIMYTEDVNKINSTEVTEP